MYYIQKSAIQYLKKINFNFNGKNQKYLISSQLPILTNLKSTISLVLPI